MKNRTENINEGGLLYFLDGEERITNWEGFENLRKRGEEIQREHHHRAQLLHCQGVQDICQETRISENSERAEMTKRGILEIINLKENRKRNKKR